MKKPNQPNPHKKSFSLETINDDTIQTQLTDDFEVATCLISSDDPHRKENKQPTTHQPTKEEKESIPATTDDTPLLTQEDLSQKQEWKIKDPSLKYQDVPQHLTSHSAPTKETKEQPTPQQEDPPQHQEQQTPQDHKHQIENIQQAISAYHSIEDKNSYRQTCPLCTKINNTNKLTQQGLFISNAEALQILQEEDILFAQWLQDKPTEISHCSRCQKYFNSTPEIKPTDIETKQLLDTQEYIDNCRNGTSLGSLAHSLSPKFRELWAHTNTPNQCRDDWMDQITTQLQDAGKIEITKDSCGYKFCKSLKNKKSTGAWKTIMQGRSIAALAPSILFLLASTGATVAGSILQLSTLLYLGVVGLLVCTIATLLFPILS